MGALFLTIILEETAGGTGCGRGLRTVAGTILRSPTSRRSSRKSAVKDDEYHGSLIPGRASVFVC